MYNLLQKLSVYNQLGTKFCNNYTQYIFVFSYFYLHKKNVDNYFCLLIILIFDPQISTDYIYNFEIHNKT